MHRTTWIAVVLALGAGTIADAQVTSPVFRGVLGMGKDAIVLFEIPGQSGNWQGHSGDTVPGTKWKIAGVSLSQGQVWINVGQPRPIAMAQGETYVSGAKAEKAPDVARPENHAAGEYLPPTPDQERRNRDLARRRTEMARQEHLAAEAKARANPPPPTSTEGLVETVDVSHNAPPLASFAKAGYLTAVMVTSPACPPCRAAHPKVETLPTKKAGLRVVFADIGVTKAGAINFQSPFFQGLSLPHVPYVFLLDASGAIGAQGDQAWGTLQRFIPDL